MRDVTRPELESAAKRLCADLKIDSDMGIGAGADNVLDVLIDLLAEWQYEVREEERGRAAQPPQARLVTNVRQIRRPRLESAAKRLCDDLEIEPAMKIGANRFSVLDCLIDMLADLCDDVRAEERVI